MTRGKLLLPCCIAGIVSLYGCGEEHTTTYVQVTCKVGDTQVCLCEGDQVGTKTCEATADGGAEFGSCTCTPGQTQPPVTKPSPCEGVTCPSGVCVPATDDTAVCVCYDDYLSSRDDNGNPTCVQSTTPVVVNNCKDIDCAGHGSCVEASDKAICVCDSGYESAVDSVLHTPTCEKSAPQPVRACDDVDCAGNGVCLEVNGGAVCRCNDGYSAAIDDDGNPTCQEGAATSGPCKDITCSDHGKCVVTSDESAYCLCDAGYTQDSETECKVDPTSPCANVTCGGHGFCGLVGDDATCWCEEGYEIDKSGSVPTCKEKAPVVDPCADINCNNHGQCFETSVGVACLCDNGFKSSSADGKPTCEAESIKSPCDGIACSGHGMCMVSGDNTAFCMCSAGYHQKAGDTVSCEEDVNVSPCKDVTCSNQGTCMVSGDDAAVCLCNAGYHQNTDDATICEKNSEADNPCKDVTCSGKGTCMVAGDDAAVCLCNTGYHQGSTPTTCEKDTVVESPCKDITCSDAGTCMVSGNNTAVCMCNAGYHQGPTPTTCEQDTVVESPCKDVTCSGHGACVVTGDNKPYCLCAGGYHLNATDSKVCDVDVVEESPCKGVTCSDHGVCIITAANEPYCVCESGYNTVSATTCKRDTSSTTGVSHGNAYPSETTDPWGLVWDTQQRPAKTHSAADELCKSLGGRLPTRNEIFRNNHSATGVGGVGDVYQTGYLWTSDHLWSAHAIVTRLNDGGYSNIVNTTANAFRCVWDPEERPIIMTGVNCHSTPGDETPCVKMTLGTPETKVIYHVDKYDRASLPWNAAQQECRRMGGRLPTSNELMTLVLAGLPNGSGSNIWTSDNVYNYEPFVFKWTGTQAASYAFSNNWSHTGWTGWQPYRCIYEDVELVDKLPVFPQAKAKDAMTVTPLLRIDKAEREAATFWDATLDCRKDGGRLAAVDEMEAAIRAGLEFTNNNWHLTRNSYGGNAWGLRSGMASSGKPGVYWDLNANYTNLGATTKYAYFCTYRPNRDSAAMVDDLEKHTENGYAYRVVQDFSEGGGAKIMHYVRDTNDRAGSTIVTNTTGSNANGMFLPAYDDLIFMIRNGLVGGNNVYLMTSTGAGWLTYRGFRWSGAGPEDYVPSANVTTVQWNSTSNPYRAYYSTVVY